MKLNRNQRETLARCFYCRAKIDPTIAGDALEAGKRPVHLRCESCGNQERVDEELKALGMERALELATERARKAGVLKAYERENLEDEMRSRGENN